MKSVPLVVVTTIAALLLLRLVVWRASWTRRYLRLLGPAGLARSAAATREVGRHSGAIMGMTFVAACALVGRIVILWQQWTQGTPSTPWVLAALVLLVPGLTRRFMGDAPAFILVLGASDEEQISLQAGIRDAMFPFRPISLLETGRSRVDGKIAGDRFRVTDGQSWRQMIARLSHDLPLIVLDLRHPTPRLELEIEHLVDAGLLYKSLVVAAKDGEMTVEDAQRRLGPSVPCGRIACVPDTGAAIGFLINLLLSHDVLPSPSRPLSTLAATWWQAPELTPVPASATPRVHVHHGRLAPFSYQPSPGWSAQLLSNEDQRHCVLFRPPEEGGLRNYLRRRSRLDLVVFPYPEADQVDEPTLQRGSETNLAARGAKVTQERFGRRAGVLTHEVFFRKDALVGFLVRFIIRRNEYLVHWMSISEAAMRRHLPTVIRFVDELVAGTTT